MISTSPQFFCGAAGYLLSRLKRKPWILEIRDLWPESIIAVGALRNRQIIRILEGIERFLYHHADHVVAVTNAFKRHIKSCGVPDTNITVITNGADLSIYMPRERDNGFRKSHQLDGKCVLSYVGTHGMAHGLETVLKAAVRIQDRKDIVFILVGDGADRKRLLEIKEKMGLENVLMLPQQPKQMVPEIISASDGCMVLLKDTPLFRTVIPSKIFEAMAMRRPIVLGVEGESRAIIERGRCGVCIVPESDTQLAEAAIRLADDPQTADKMGENGLQIVKTDYSREALANSYLSVLHGMSSRK